jgi:tryptophan synthase alpha chain
MPDSNFYVSLTGITGAKLSNVEVIQHNIGKLKKVSAAPVAVGFGVSTPEDAAQVSKVADGVIVGSAIVKRIASHQQDPEMMWHVAEFVGFLKSAVAPA